MEKRDFILPYLWEKNFTQGRKRGGRMISEEATKATIKSLLCHIEALEETIKALEQEPCEDMVSRQTVSYIIKSHIHEIMTESGTDKNAHTNAVLRAIVNLVETVPSVTPTRKKGKWIEIDDYPNEEYECSVCGRIVEVTSANIKPEEEYPYCHCGAYMGADTGEVEE